MKILNPNLNPWNIYNDQCLPDKTVTANVYAAGKEWYNSFMPPFFLLRDFYLIERIKRQMDSKNLSFERIAQTTQDGHIYLKLSKNYFSKKNRIHNLQLQYGRVKTFFYKESKLLNDFDKANNIYNFAALLLVSINLMQKYMNPLEAFVTGKENSYCNDSMLFKNEAEQLSQNAKIPMVESIFIPLAVLFSQGKNNSIQYKSVFEHLRKILSCTKSQLDFTFDYTNKKYLYSAYMDCPTAQEIIEIYFNKLITFPRKKLKLLPAYYLQAIGGFMTWSKYIPISKNPLRFRYFCEIDSLEKLISFPEISNDRIFLKETKVVSTAGSERFAKTIYVVSTLLKNSSVFKTKVKKVASEKYNVFFEKT